MTDTRLPVNLYLLYGLVSIVVLATLVGFMMLDTVPTTTFQAGRLSVAYPNIYHKKTTLLPGEGQHASYILRLEAKAPTRTIDLSKETGAIIAANATRSNFLDYLEKVSGKSLPATYNNFQQLDSQRIKISARDAYTVSFTYSNQGENQTVVYAKLFVIPIDNDAYYLTMQSVDQKRLRSESEVLQNSLKIN